MHRATAVGRTRAGLRFHSAAREILGQPAHSPLRIRMHRTILPGFAVTRAQQLGLTTASGVKATATQARGCLDGRLTPPAILWVCGDAQTVRREQECTVLPRPVPEPIRLAFGESVLTTAMGSMATVRLVFSAGVQTAFMDTARQSALYVLTAEITVRTAW